MGFSYWLKVPIWQVYNDHCVNRTERALMTGYMLGGMDGVTEIMAISECQSVMPLMCRGLLIIKQSFLKMVRG